MLWLRFIVVFFSCITFDIMFLYLYSQLIARVLINLLMLSYK